jgi:hypothetical protein
MSLTAIAGVPGQEGFKDGKSSEALFGILKDIVVDKKGYLYVADYGAGIRKISPDGEVTTPSDSFEYPIRYPNILALDRNEHLYIFQESISLVKTDLNTPFLEEIETSMSSANPFVVDNIGDIYFCSTFSIIKNSNGKETLFAGHKTIKGFVDGPLLEARFNSLTCLCLCRNGDILVGEGNIRKISNGMVSTVFMGKLGKIGSIVEDGKGRYFFNAFYGKVPYGVYMINPNGETILTLDVATPFIAADITGIYFTDTRSYLVKKLHFPVTWTPGKYSVLFVNIYFSTSF